MPGRGDGYPGTPWILVSYLALAVVFFLPALLPGRQIFGTDYLAEAYFLEVFATGRLAAGELPKWVPHLFGGVPFFANPMDVYYPVSVLLRIFQVPTHEHLGWIFVVQFTLAGIGTYAILRELGARPFVAHMAGILYMFSGYLISYVYAGHDGRAIVATLAPMFLFTLHRALRLDAWRWFVLAGLVLGSALLSFQIQTAYYLLLAAGLWFLFLLWHLELWRPLPALGRRIAGGLLTLVLGFSLSAVNFLPFLSYIEASPRGGGGRGYEFATSWSMPPLETIGLAVPERIGILDAYWGANPFKLHTEYAGALTLLLVVVGLYLLRRDRYGWFFLGLAVFALTIAFGGHTPLYRVYYALLPGTSMFRAPSTVFYIVVLALVAFGGLTFERLARLRAEREEEGGERSRAADAELRTASYIAAATFGIVLFWGVLVGATPPPNAAVGGGDVQLARAAANHEDYVIGIWRFALFFAMSAGVLWAWLGRKAPVLAAAAMLGAVTVADLWILDKRFFDAVPGPSVYFAPDEVADFLGSREGRFRTFVLFDQPQTNYLPLFGIELVAGQHGNRLQSYNEFLGAGERTYTDFHNMGSPTFLSLANVRYLVTGREIAAPFLEQVFRGRTRGGGPAGVYENPSVLPRVFVVGAARSVAEPAGAIRAMQEPGFDPLERVLLYAEPPLAGADVPGPAGTARILRYEPDQVVVEVSAERPGYLVLTDNFYPDWEAELDGNAVPLLRAYHTFRAVPVGPGEHTVSFWFRPRALAVGFGIYLLVWALLGAFGLGLLVARWRARPAPA